MTGPGDNGARSRVSAAMIVRNEETFLPDCLRSIVDEVDEIVVVDTGSVDKTREIAAHYGARIIERPWTNDFSAARNCAIDHATGDWILYIDADERLAVPTPGALRAAIRDPDLVALWMLFRIQVNYTLCRELRLFRRDDRIRFRGVIHETAHPDLESVAQSDGLLIGRTDIRLDHLGYDGDLTAKHHRNLPLLEAAVRVTPERVFLWVDMAQALVGLGRRAEAVRACWRALDAASALPDEKQTCDAAQAWQWLVNLHLDSDPAEAVALARRGLSVNPGHHALQLMLANALFAAGEAASIPDLLDPLSAIDGETFEDPLVAYDKRIFGEWAHDLMGAAYARMGRREEAAAAFGKAAALDPGNLAYRAKAAVFSGVKAG